MNVETTQWLFANAGEIISKAIFVASLILFAYALFRLKTIAKIVTDLNEAKSSIKELNSAVTILKDGSLKREIDSLNKTIQIIANADISAKIADVKDSIDSTQQQLIELQRFAADDVPAKEGDEQDAKIDFWPNVRSIWQHARDYLETRVASTPLERIHYYERLPRTNYKKIIEQLKRDGLLSGLQAVAALRMNQAFNVYRFRQRHVTQQDFDNFNQWAHDLREVPFSASQSDQFELQPD